MAIAVSGGRARFQVPTPDRARRTLVIVSTLAITEGPFSTRLTARGTSRVDPPALAEETGRRTPDLQAKPLEPVSEPVGGLPPPARTFHVLARDGDVASASNYLPIQGVLRAVGQRIQVYVDAPDVPQVSDDVLRDLVATFDGHVFPVAARTIGQARDVDGDGRFTVLLSSWLRRLAGGRYAVDGFVRGADLDPSFGAPFSNRCDMMYLNAALRAGPYLRTVVAHEYTHAVTYSAKTFTGPAGERLGMDEDGWLDEALAHLGEDLHGFSRANLDYRISAFLSDPSRYQLVVNDYYLADLFRSHGNRGSTYLFLRWCADRFGDGLLPALIRSNRRGIANLEAATGTRFADLYRQWAIALYFSGFDPRGGTLEGFRSLRLRGAYGGWELAGPRTSHLVPDGRPETWAAKGTSTRFVVIDGSPRGAVEVEVSGPPEAQLQVTAIPLADDLPDLDLAASLAPASDGSADLRTTIGERSGLPVALTSVAWEPLVPDPDAERARMGRGTRGGAVLREVLGSTSLVAGASLGSAPIRLEKVFPGFGPLVVKVLGTDTRGRRVAAWAEVGSRDETVPAVAGAEPAATGR